MADSSNHDKRIILLSRVSTYRARAFHEAAENLGIEVVHGVDMDSRLVDYWQVPLGIQFDEPELAAQHIFEFAQKQPVRAVISVDDSASVIAAMASELLGLPHNDGQAALAARNKFVMRQMLLAGGVACPEFALYSASDNPADFSANIDYPVVIKPLLLSGSRGVIRVDSPSEFEAGFQRVVRMLRDLQDEPGSAQILVETYLPGGEVALEGILDQGKLRVLALFDKPDPLVGPFFEETIYVTPSRLPAATQAAIAECTEKAVAALGLYHGPIHAELRINDDGPWILEVAGRSIGGLCSKTLQFGGDISLEALILRQAVGMDIESFTRQNRAEGVMMIPIPEAGILKGYSGVADAEQVLHVSQVEITAECNYPLMPLPEGDSYLGFIFADGETPDAVEEALRQAHEKLSFEIEPMLPLI